MISYITSINKQLFTDGTHLTVEGYRVWAESIEPIVSEIVRENCERNMELIT